VQAFDIMGNGLSGRAVMLTATPIYLVAAQAADLAQLFPNVNK
jgi:hypothetical protein